PLQPSPFYHNYFASCFHGIDPDYGNMADWWRFIRRAHQLGLKVYLDEEFQYIAQGHPWWRKALTHPHGRFADYLLWKNRKKGIAEPFLDQRKWQSWNGTWIGIAMLNLENPALRN